jgi:hypothetical protein
MVTVYSSPSRTAEGVAARHQCVLLVNEHPELWPLLNELTLIGQEWPVILQRLRSEEAPNA